MSETTKADQEKVERDGKVRAAYAIATSALRDKYRDEFDALLKAEYAKAGVTVKVRLTPEQRAEAEQAKKAEREARVRAKKAEKLAELRAMMEALEAEVGDPAPAPVEPPEDAADDEPLF